jgi:hypothetical protein
MDDLGERRFKERIESLPAWMRITVDSVARQLQSVGAYNGSETDSVTDALAILHNIFPETGYGEALP